ncbi:hypothetical protein Tco_1281644 [Tanacetum coccineum]
MSSEANLHRDFKIKKPSLWITQTEDSTDEDVPEFKFLKPKTKGKASSSTACCDDTSDQEFPDDDDSSDEDFPELKLKKAKTCKDSSDEDIPNSFKSQVKTSKGKASYSTAYKTRGSNSSKSKGVPQAITIKCPVPQPIIVKSPIAIKNCLFRVANRKMWDLIQKKQFEVRKPTLVTVAEGRKGKRKIVNDSSFWCLIIMSVYVIF